MKLLNAMSDLDDKFKEKLVAFYGVEDEDDLKGVNEELYDFEAFTEFVEPKLDEAAMKTTLERIIKEETGKEEPRAEHIEWVIAQLWPPNRKRLLRPHALCRENKLLFAFQDHPKSYVEWAITQIPSFLGRSRPAMLVHRTCVGCESPLYGVFFCRHLAGDIMWKQFREMFIGMGSVFDT